MDALKLQASAATDSLSLEQARGYGKKATLHQAGKAFEGLFMHTMMKAMREAQIEGGLFESEAEKPFRTMLDQAYSDLAVKNMRLGIAESIERQFSPKTQSKAGQDVPMLKP